MPSWLATPNGAHYTGFPGKLSLQLPCQDGMDRGSDPNPTIAQLAMRATNDVEELGPASCHALISCSKSKGGHRDLARNMYVSALYRKSVMVAEAGGLSFNILS